MVGYCTKTNQNTNFCLQNDLKIKKRRKFENIDTRRIKYVKNNEKLTLKSSRLIWYGDRVWNHKCVVNPLTRVQSSRQQLRVKQKITIQDIGIYRNELERHGNEKKWYKSNHFLKEFKSYNRRIRI